MDWIRINNNQYKVSEILNDSISFTDDDPFPGKVCRIIRDWHHNRQFFSFSTSGSTGRPKMISIHRDQMKISALSTLGFLGIRKGTALLCLDPDFIAGCMMIIRAIEGKMNLAAVTPASDPLEKFQENIPVTLSAMVPLQIGKILENPGSKRKLAKIRYLLIGGARLPVPTEKKMASLSNGIYQTFGMTETVSHLALRKINGSDREDYFQVLPGIKIDQDHRGCLVVQGDITGNHPVMTNDIIEIAGEHRFRWIGRYDHVINSGGVKMVVESLENKIRSILVDHELDYSFFVTGTPDDHLGERVCMVIEKSPVPEMIIGINKILRAELTKYEKPREFRMIPEFIQTPTGKINREKTYEMAEIITGTNY